MGELALGPLMFGSSATLLNADHYDVYFKGMPIWNGKVSKFPLLLYMGWLQTLTIAVDFPQNRFCGGMGMCLSVLLEDITVHMVGQMIQ